MYGLRHICFKATAVILVFIRRHSIQKQNQKKDKLKEI